MVESISKSESEKEELNANPRIKSKNSRRPSLREGDLERKTLSQYHGA